MTKLIPIPSIMIERIDSFSILEGMMQHTALPCHIVVCSFAIVEGWIKRLDKLKQKGKIERITVVLDNAVMIRHRSKIKMMENIIDNILLNDTHAKMLLVESNDFSAAAVLSANATMNYRIESAYITNRADEIKKLKQDLQKIYDNSNSIRTS